MKCVRVYTVVHSKYENNQQCIRSTTMIMWIPNKVHHLHKGLSFIYSNLNARYATRVSTTRIYPRGYGKWPTDKVHINWYSNQDGSNQGKFKFFFIYVFLIHNAHSLLLTVGCVFPLKVSTGTLIIIWSDLTLKASNKSAVTISVQLELITLIVCKLHNNCIVY